jgi:hypothetical protein
MTTATTNTCPTWCEAIHLEDSEGIIHDRVLLGAATGHRFACVALESDGDGPAQIFLDVTHKEQILTPEEAAQVGAALLEAVRLGAAGVQSLNTSEHPYTVAEVAHILGVSTDEAAELMVAGDAAVTR